jgi:signal transduction histidine kinase
LTDGIPVALSAQPVDLRPLVTKIVDEVRVAHPTSTIEMRVAGDCFAQLDVDRFEQVISNVVGNAVAHGDTTKPIRIALTTTPGGVSLTVHNDGTPIDPDFLPMLFNPFARGEKPRGQSEGLGLGLYISERIIDAHGGRLSVQSSLDAGTVFEVILPRRL